MVFISDSTGRFATSYVAQCIINKRLKDNAGISNNHDFRLYLQRNAKKIMQTDRDSLNTIKIQCDCPQCLLISENNFKN